MEKSFEEELKEFCFDVLGDFMEERAYCIEKFKSGYAVCVIYEGLVHAPKEIIRDDWQRAIKDTKFENVGLYM